MVQPSQAVIERLPRGYPPTREHLHDSDYPMASELQRRLAEIGKQNLAECPEGSRAAAYFSEE
jgi:hypothetical protein